MSDRKPTRSQKLIGKRSKHGRGTGREDYSASTGYQSNNSRGLPSPSARRKKVKFQTEDRHRSRNGEGCNREGFVVAEASVTSAVTNAPKTASPHTLKTEGPEVPQIQSAEPSDHGMRDEMIIDHSKKLQGRQQRPSDLIEPSNAFRNSHCRDGAVPAPNRDERALATPVTGEHSRQSLGTVYENTFPLRSSSNVSVVMPEDLPFNLFVGELAPDDEDQGTILDAVDVHPLEEETDESDKVCSTRLKRWSVLGCFVVTVAVGLAVGLYVGTATRVEPTLKKEGRDHRTCDNESSWKKVGSEITHPERYSKANWIGTIALLTKAFGSSVSLSSDGRSLAIAGRFDDVVSVYKLNRSGASLDWSQLGADITSSSAVIFRQESDLYKAHSTAVLSGDGKRVVAAFPHFTDDEIKNRGSVTVHEYADGSWAPVGDDFLGLAPNAYLGDRGTVDLNFDGTILAIGDFRHRTNTGRVQIFRDDHGGGGQNWTQLGQSLHGQSSGDDFGTAVSLSDDGTVVAVGAPYAKSKRGLVRVFRYDDENDSGRGLGGGGSWVPLGEPIKGVEDTTCGFGQPVTLSSGIGIRVVAYGSGPAPNGTRCIDFLETGNNIENKGVVSVYEFVDGNWNRMGASIMGKRGGESFGWALDLSGNGGTLAIGAMGGSRNGLEDSGYIRTYRCDAEDKHWMHAPRTDINGSTPHDWAGSSVALSHDGERLAVGAPGDFRARKDTSGSVSVFSHCW